MQLVNAIYNEEVCQLYLKYEAEIHGKTGKSREDFQRNCCNNQLFDHENEPEKASTPMLEDRLLLVGHLQAPILHAKCEKLDFERHLRLKWK